MTWSELEGRMIKQVLGDGDLEFAKQNNIPDCVYLILDDDKGLVVIEALPSDDKDDTRPWLRLRREGDPESGVFELRKGVVK